MKLTGSRTYYTPSPPKMPAGIVELMEGMTREVLKHNPTDVYAFCAGHMQQLLEKRDGPLRKRTITLEEKILIAQKKVKQRIEKRWQQYDENVLPQVSENKNDEILNRVSETASLPKHKETVNVPIHNEQDLSNSSEIEISHGPCATNRGINIIPHSDNVINAEAEVKDQIRNTISDETENVKNELIHANQIASESNGNSVDDNVTTERDIMHDENNMRNNDLHNNKEDHHLSKKDIDEQSTVINHNDLVNNNQEQKPDIIYNIKNTYKEGNILNINETEILGTNIDNLCTQDQGNYIKGHYDNIPNFHHVDTSIKSDNTTEITIKQLPENSNELLLKECDKVTPDKYDNTFKEIDPVESEKVQYSTEMNLDEHNTEPPIAEKLCTQEQYRDIKENYNNTSNSHHKDPSIKYDNTTETNIKHLAEKSPDSFLKECDEITPEQIENTLQEITPLESEKMQHTTEVKYETNLDEHKIALPLTEIENEDVGSLKNETIQLINNIDNSPINVEHLQKLVNTQNCNYVGNIEENIDKKDSVLVQEELPEHTKVVDNNTNTIVTGNTTTEIPISVKDKSLISDVSLIEDSVDKISLNISVTGDEDIIDLNGIKNDTINEFYVKNSSVINIDPENGDINTDNQNANVKHPSDFEAIESNTNINSESNYGNLNLETAAVTIQKVFRSFLFKSRASTSDDTNNDEENSLEEENGKKEETDFSISSALNKERRPHGITRMDTVLQTVNEEKSLSLSTDDSSTLSSAATIIQAHVRGFLVRNKLNSNKTLSTNSFPATNSNEPSLTSLDNDNDQQKNKTVLNIHIVPEGGNLLSRDESLITSMELSLDGSPPSSISLHPLGYNKSERRKQLKREDAIQSISPPSNNSGKLSEDVDSVKEFSINGNVGAEKQVVETNMTLNSVNEEAATANGKDAVEISKDIPVMYGDVSNDMHAISTETGIKQKEESRKMSSDEMDVVTPFISNDEKSSSVSDTKLMHSGEFHDVLLPTRVSRNDTTVVRGE